MIVNLYNNLKEICDKRKSHRFFKDIRVPDDIIDKIMYIAGTSPYVSGKHNWEITVIKDREILRDIALAVKNMNSMLLNYIEDDYADGFKQYSSNFVFFENAPAVFFLNYREQQSVSIMLKKSLTTDELASGLSGSDLKTSLKADIQEWERDSYVKSISCVAMLILLAAESLGLGACYMTGPLLAEKEISQIINVKKGRRIGAIIPVGYY